MNPRKVILLCAFFIMLLTSLFPQNIYLLVVFSSMAWGLMPLRRWWDGTTVCLLLFSAFYTAMVMLRGQVASGFVTVSYLIAPVAFYRFGHYLMYVIKGDTARFRLILSVAAAYLLQVFILTSVSIAMTGIVNESRTLIGYSAQSGVLAATLYGLMTSFGTGCMGACFTKELSASGRVLYAAVVLLSLLTVVHLVNRGGLVIAVACALLSVLYVSKVSAGRLVPIIFFAAISALLLFWSGIIDGEIFSAYEERNSYGGYGMATAGGRTELWMSAFADMLTHPSGWTQEGYAHNLWLDMARVGGWIPLVPFLVVTFREAGNVMSLFRRTRSGFALLMLSLNLALALAAFIEPVIEGSMLFFCLLLLVWGMTDALRRETTD